MSTQTLDQPAATETGEKKPAHLFCQCNDFKAACGYETLDWTPFLPEDYSGPKCGVCAELANKPCPYCGSTWPV